MRLLVRSWEEFEKSEAYNSLMLAINAMKDQLTAEWARGMQGAERNQKAVAVLQEIPKIAEFAKKRLNQIEDNEKKLREWTKRKNRVTTN